VKGDYPNQDFPWDVLVVRHMPASHEGIANFESLLQSVADRWRGITTDEAVSLKAALSGAEALSGQLGAETQERSQGRSNSKRTPPSASIAAGFARSCLLFRAHLSTCGFCLFNP
jgi:hypothetical protein